ncbi:hypothetical protein B14911_21948, partial [Bacillus sp. NRRL B-14911]
MCCLQRNNEFLPTGASHTTGGSTMHQDQAVIKISTAEAVVISLLLLGVISFSIIGAGAVPHVPIIGAIIALLIYGLLKKVRMKDLEEGMAEGARSGLGAVFIF